MLSDNLSCSRGSVVQPDVQAEADGAVGRGRNAAILGPREPCCQVEG